MHVNEDTCDHNMYEWCDVSLTDRLDFRYQYIYRYIR